MDANPTNSEIKQAQYPGEQFSSRPTVEEYYNTNYPSKGLMIIFSQKLFPNSHNQPREGTEKDVEKLRETFSSIGYTVLDYTDMKTDEIRTILNEAAVDDHTDRMSLIIVMLTHGLKENVLYTYDSTIKVEELWSPFKADKCPTLAGKPKLLFIQACKGDSIDQGAFVEMSSTECLQSKTTLDSPTSRSNKFVIPIVADFLIFYSTTEGFPSFRNNESGSYFIQTLCRKFDELLREENGVDLERILKTVQREIAYGFQSSITMDGYRQYNACKQMPMYTSMLTKVLILKRN